MAGSESTRKDRPPVTLLCGFLGAGKTTLLNHLVSQAAGERWALVVNDVAAINIDGRLVSEGVRAGRQGGAAPEVVELGNGCVCCSIRDALAETVAELAMTGREGGPSGRPYDRILVETTGVAEPRAIAGQFIQRNLFGRCLEDFARLQALVTVVDAGYFLSLWQERGAIRAGQAEKADRRFLTGERGIMELMLEQVEVADVIVLNKSDRVAEASRAVLESIVSGLNGRAEVHWVEHGQIAREVLLDRDRFDPTATLGGAEWLRALNARAPLQPVLADERRGQGVRAVPRWPGGGGMRHQERFGLRSIVYQSRRPFSRPCFESWIRSGIPGLVRAKGFCWWREQPDEMGFLSLAGDEVRIDTLNFWWAALIENGKASLSDRPEMIRALWQEPGGDRRQELVFIGAGLDEEKIRADLAGCEARL